MSYKLDRDKQQTSSKEMPLWILTLQTPQATVHSSLVADAWFAWHSMHKSMMWLRQIAQLSTTISVYKHKAKWTKLVWQFNNITGWLIYVLCGYVWFISVIRQWQNKKKTLRKVAIIQKWIRTPSPQCNGAPLCREAKRQQSRFLINRMF